MSVVPVSDTFHTENIYTNSIVVQHFHLSPVVPVNQMRVAHMAQNT